MTEGRGGLDRWLLERLAPGDTEAALADLREERSAGVLGPTRYWLQVAGVCAYGVRDRLRQAGPGALRLGGLQPLLALRLAARGLRRAPGTSLTAVLTLGVGLTAAVVVLGILHGTTRPLPVPEGEEIVGVRLADARSRAVDVPAGPAAVWAGAPALDGAAGLRSLGGTLVRAGQPALRTAGAAMEPAAFPLLGVRPALGRWPTTESTDAAAVLLGWEAHQALGGAEVLGSEVRIEGVPHTVVGVMPPDFGFPENQDFWTVLPPDAVPEEVVARLADGATPAGAARAVESRLAALPVPADVEGPYRVRVVGWVGGRGEGGEAVAFGGLAALVAFLVIICAANVSTLLLVRGTERAGVLAVQSALGAARVQVAFQLFLEALLVALAGGVVGLLGGGALLRLAQLRLSEHFGYYWMRMEVRPEVVLGALAVVMGAAVLAGTAPAVRASRVDLRDVLAGGGRGASGRRERRLGRWFVGVQVALSTVGMVAALAMGLGIRNSGNLTAALPVHDVAVGMVTPPAAYDEPAARAALALRLQEELGRIPGATAASVSQGLPGFQSRFVPLALPGDDAGETAPRQVGFMAADGHLLETYGLTLVRGRNFDAGDDHDAPPVALVTASYARTHLEGRDPMGTRLRLAGVHGEDAWAQVVGVVADWYPAGPNVRPDRVLVPLAQAGPGPLRISVRAPGNAAALVPELRAAVTRVDPELPVDRPETLASLMAWLLRMPRVIAGFGLVGGLAGVLVAAIGLYGVVAFQVRARLPEVGVRMALGASAGRILGEVLRETLLRVAPGVAIGLALAALAAPVLTFLSFGADARAPGLYLAAFTAMAGVGLAAALGPSLRAARLEPQSVLRGE